MKGNHRSDIKVGARVKVVQKQDQRSGSLTEGIVRDILANRVCTLTASRCAWKTASSAGSRRS